MNIRIIASFFCCYIMYRVVSGLSTKASEVGINGPGEGPPVLPLCRPAKLLSSVNSGWYFYGEENGGNFRSDLFCRLKDFWCILIYRTLGRIMRAVELIKNNYNRLSFPLQIIKVWNNDKCKLFGNCKVKFLNNQVGITILKIIIR